MLLYLCQSQFNSKNLILSEQFIYYFTMISPAHLISFVSCIISYILLERCRPLGFASLLSSPFNRINFWCNVVFCSGPVQQPCWRCSQGWQSRDAGEPGCPAHLDGDAPAHHSQPHVSVAWISVTLLPRLVNDISWKTVYRNVHNPYNIWARVFLAAPQNY